MNPNGKITPLFAVVFSFVIFLTVLSIGIQTALVFYGPESDMAKQLAEDCSTGWKTGTAAIFGLIGGKSL